MGILLGAHLEIPELDISQKQYLNKATSYWYQPEFNKFWDYIKFNIILVFGSLYWLHSGHQWSINKNHYPSEQCGLCLAPPVGCFGGAPCFSKENAWHTKGSTPASRRTVAGTLTLTPGSPYKHDCPGSENRWGDNSNSMTLPGLHDSNGNFPCVFKHLDSFLHILECLAMRLNPLREEGKRTEDLGEGLSFWGKRHWARCMAHWEFRTTERHQQLSFCPQQVRPMNSLATAQTLLEATATLLPPCIFSTSPLCCPSRAPIKDFQVRSSTD